MPRVFHFEIQADEPKRAASFYERVFGWKISKKQDGKDDYWLIYTGSPSETGINGGLKKRMQPNMSNVPAVEVSNFEEFTQKIEASGGKLLTPKLSITNSGFVVYCQDTEGNVFSIIEKDPSVK
jgi:uncharacterized protein